MTKNEFHKKADGLVERLAKRFGAEIVDGKQLVGGKEQVVRRAEGGAFDLDACRGLLANAFSVLENELIEAALPKLPASKPSEGGEKPDGKPDLKVA